MGLLYLIVAFILKYFFEFEIVNILIGGVFILGIEHWIDGYYRSKLEKRIYEMENSFNG